MSIKLITALYNLIADDTIQLKYVRVIAINKDREQAKKLLKEINNALLDDYTRAQVIINDKTAQNNETTSNAKHFSRIIEKVMARSLLVASWAHDTNTPLTDIRALRVAEMTARKYYGRL